MKDQRLRESFVALCEHLNVAKKWDGEFDHDSKRFSERCRLVRKSEFDTLQRQIEELQESIQELRKKKK